MREGERVKRDGIESGESEGETGSEEAPQERVEKWDGENGEEEVGIGESVWIAAEELHREDLEVVVYRAEEEALVVSAGSAVAHVGSFEWPWAGAVCSG